MALFVLITLGKRRALKYLIAVDLGVCVFAHGEFRTISGMTGEKSVSNHRYYYQMKVIDLLLKPFDGDNHCVNAHKWEQSIQYNYFEWFNKLKG